MRFPAADFRWVRPLVIVAVAVRRQGAAARSRQRAGRRASPSGHRFLSSGDISGARLRRLPRQAAAAQGRARCERAPRADRRWSRQGGGLGRAQVKPDDGAARRGDAGLVEWPVVLMGAHRPGIHGPAARGADHLDAHASEIFRLPRRRGQARRRVSSSSPTWPRDDGGSGDRRRQRARAARAPVRCALLLGAGPQGAARSRVCRSSPSGSSTPSSAACSTRSARMRQAGRRAGATSCREPTRTDWCSAPRARQGRSVDRHGRRISRAARRDGPLLRAP